MRLISMPARGHGLLGPMGIVALALFAGAPTSAPAADPITKSQAELTKIIDDLRATQSRLDKRGAAMRDSELRAILGRLDRADRQLSRTRGNLKRNRTAAKPTARKPISRVAKRRRVAPPPPPSTHVARSAARRQVDPLRIFQLQARLAATERSLAETRRKLDGNSAARGPRSLDGAAEIYAIKARIAEAERDLAKSRARLNTTPLLTRAEIDSEPLPAAAVGGDTRSSGELARIALPPRRPLVAPPSPGARAAPPRQRATKTAAKPTSAPALDTAPLVPRSLFDDPPAPRVSDETSSVFAKAEYVPVPARKPAPPVQVASAPTTAPAASPAARGGAAPARADRAARITPMRPEELDALAKSLTVSAEGLNTPDDLPAASGVGTPTGTPLPLVDRLQTAMLFVSEHSERLGFAGRWAHLEPVVRVSFDFKAMARFAVGTYWTAMTPDQQLRVTEGIGSLIVALVADRFDFWYGQKFEVQGQRDRADKVRHVSSKIVLPFFGYTFPIDYLAHWRDGRWYLIDVMPGEGYSEALTRRGEFTSVLRRLGVDGFFASLDRKLAGIKRRARTVALVSTAR